MQYDFGLSGLNGPRRTLTLVERLSSLNWALVILVIIISGVGGAMLFSAAGGNMDPWASRHLVRAAIFIGLMLFIALVDIRIWMQLAYPIYALGFALLILVEFVGTSGGGAERWLDLKVIQIQPSEFMKIAVVIALARYFNGLTLKQIGNPLYLIIPALLTLVPAAVVLKQPDLGTSLLIVIVGGSVFFVAGLRLWKLALAVMGAAAVAPFLWLGLKPYQQRRVLTFIDPENDPLGAGYHIIQSKIAFGSGGFVGKGFLSGTQGQLQFLPEAQTDFVFALIAEEMGFLGAMVVIFLFVILIAISQSISFRSENHFGRLLAAGLTANIFFYLFVNIGMVMGMLPVVGVPLPLVSYGGSAMLATVVCLGLIMCVHVHRSLSITGEDH